MKKNYENDLSFFEMQLTSHNIPTTLHHYTSLNSLIGIVDRKELWFTNIEYLNDITEFKEGKDLFLKNLSKVESEFESPETYASIKSYIKEEIIPYDFFSFSLSEEEDSLEQWRGYANNENGVMITFQGIFGYLKSQGIECIKVVYDEEPYEKEICSLIEKMKKWDFSNADFDLFYFWGKFNRVLANVFLKKKNSIFKNEREWKLCYSHREIDDIDKSDDDAIEDKIRFRLAKNYIIPYSILNFRRLKFFDKTHFIHEVLISPTIKEKEIDGNRSLEGIKRLLTKNKVERASEKVKFSSLPYR